ncbi:hypothetical protein AAD018_004935 [Aestuariibius insulae]|uniref:hypothetical protein n=1 Tax=Aestuariibius insulae TaxID=2058287 RepID=UPI00345EEAAC
MGILLWRSQDIAHDPALFKDRQSLSRFALSAGNGGLPVRSAAAKAERHLM